MPVAPAPAPPPRRQWLTAVAAGALLVCAGCAQPGGRLGRGRPGEDGPEADQDGGDLPGRGPRGGRPDGMGAGPGAQAGGHAYAPVQQAPFSISRHHWPLLGAETTAITLLLPATPGPWPLVLYLPGLGETAESGAQWRNAWAGAGYAVLSAQVLDDDATAWRSDLARAGQFDQVARRHFGPELMARRLAAWQNLVAQARQRAAAGEAPWTRLDWQRVALAGHELGAATALQAVRGALPSGAAAALAGLSPQALILFSPYEAQGAALAGTAPMRSAVLGITGPADADPLGLLPAPDVRAARTALIDRLPAADRSLLLLDGLPHGLLGDTLSPAAEAAAAGVARDNATRDDAGSRGGSTRRRSGSPGDGGGPAGGSSGGMGGGMGRSRGDEGGAVRGAGRGNTGTGVDAMRLRIVAAQDVSTAWLDARVLGDAGARDWLVRKAPAWVAGMGSLQAR